MNYFILLLLFAADVLLHDHDDIDATPVISCQSLAIDYMASYSRNSNHYRCIQLKVLLQPCSSSSSSSKPDIS